MNKNPKKDLNLLLGGLTNFGYFIFMSISFFLGNIILPIFLYYRLVKPQAYDSFIKSIQTTETFGFRKKIDVEPLYDEDDDGREYEINENFKEESIEVEQILKKLQKKQLGGVNSKSNIHRYIYGGMEASLLGYILGIFATINWFLNVNYIGNSSYTLFTTFIMVVLLFFYNIIFEKIYGTKSKFQLVDTKVWDTFKKVEDKSIEEEKINFK